MNKHDDIRFLTRLKEGIPDVVEGNIYFLAFWRIKTEAVWVAFEDTNCLFASDCWPDNQVVQLRDFFISSLDELFLGQMCIFFFCICRSDLLWLFLFDKTDRLLDLVVHIGKILAVLWLKGQFLDKDRIAT